MSTIDLPITDELALPAGTDLGGIAFRRYRGLDDIPGMADVADTANRATGSVQSRSVETMLAQYRNLSNCDPDQDIVVVEADGRTVAYGRTWWNDRNEGVRTFESISFVDPTCAGRGIEEVLLVLGEERQLVVAAAMKEDLAGRPAALTRYVRGDQPAALARLEQRGYHLARRNAELARPDFEDIPAMPVPQGFELRRIDPTEPGVTRRAWAVAAEAFADNYGEHGESEEDYQRWIESPEFRPDLWCVAFESATGEVAGQILNYIGEPEPDGSAVGWTESIAVRKPYRRRGLASAMLAESLRIVRDAGAASAALGVDQENPNQAQTLYERLGFRVTLEELEYQRPIDLAGPTR